MTGREIKETPFVYEEKPGAQKVLEIKKKLNGMGINYLLNVGPGHTAGGSARP